MTTDQNYDQEAPEPNDIEPTAKYPGDFTLTLSAGEGANTLHWALVEYRDSLIKEAATELEKNDLDGYLISMNAIENLDTMLTELFEQVNGELATVRREQMRVSHEVRNQKIANLLSKLNLYSFLRL